MKHHKHLKHDKLNSRGSRLFEKGSMKLLVLKLLEEKPHHGYEIIKSVGQLVGGDYSPSPSVIYPRLTSLTEQGLVNSSERDDGLKEYSITPQGKLYLDQFKVELNALLGRLQMLQSKAAARRVPEIEQAMENLKTALHQRFTIGEPEIEMTDQIAKIINQAATRIGQL